jgi:hypothetical protein
MEKGLILYFRFVMAWTFLYAASHQVLSRMPKHRG